MGEQHPGASLDEHATVLCRCEEILRDEILAAIGAGARTVNDVKRRTRAGMGACQGIFCVPAMAVLVAEGAEGSIEEVAPMTSRPPARPIPLDALATFDDI